VKDGAIIDLPLIERLVEIEIDERAAGTIRIRPRQASATVNLRPYDELKIDGVPVAQDAGRRALAAAGEDISGPRSSAAMITASPAACHSGDFCADFTDDERPSVRRL
jgi:hypothetical protein